MLWIAGVVLGMGIAYLSDRHWEEGIILTAVSICVTVAVLAVKGEEDG